MFSSASLDLCHLLQPDVSSELAPYGSNARLYHSLHQSQSQSGPRGAVGRYLLPSRARHTTANQQCLELVDTRLEWEVAGGGSVAPHRGRPAILDSAVVLSALP